MEKALLEKVKVNVEWLIHHNKNLTKKQDYVLDDILTDINKLLKNSPDE